MTDQHQDHGNLANAIRVARIGGTIAELAAAAISADTLYHLGGQLDLGPASAWLLPAALDVYAFTALAVAYNLPVEHPGQKPVLRNARLAFSMSLACNALDHFLKRAGRLVDPLTRDLLLVAVASLPPLIVERLLNLQSLLTRSRGRSAQSGRVEAAPEEEEPARMGEEALAHAAAAEEEAEPQLARPPDQEVVWTGRPDWVAHGREIFANLSTQLSRRPSGREFQAALAAETRRLSTSGHLPAGTRPPSISSAKRIRAAIEADT
ncbi:hypothetical protein Caci_6863 [Catenulispora acidiphila DSM 44928]|uniref:Uncharacterized protein n=1 Tax=Catenulispora acidiphila (strain DSM 44928 / JCM 14897 / NBRC 102108 / NRRL B-24433 / ID139908) TaxID=479433 RepID=C7Q3D8_CATAD|nr:DUF2637 domain-containing protein [Catenulispora acidiphila]ACU75703.1 hypothetical protein Caci_6863 [Catenulispora acidiphila DSM 44928]